MPIVIIFKRSFIWDCEICYLPFIDNSIQTYEEEAGREREKC